jgi:protein TIF31
MDITPEKVHLSIRSVIFERFRYKLRQDEVSCQISLLRSICLKVGIQIETKNYKLKSKGSGIFIPSDILNHFPVIKKAVPRASFAEDAFEHGQFICRKDAKVGKDIMKEAIQMKELIYGPIYPDTGKSYAILAMHIFTEEKNYAEAIVYQKRAVIVYERCLGTDDADTLQQYNNLAYFEHVAGNHESGLELMLHSFKLSIAARQFQLHPEAATAYSNTGTMLQTLQVIKKAENTNSSAKLNMTVEQMEIALSMHQKAVDLNTQLFGIIDPVTNSSRELLIHSLFVNGEYRKALSCQKQVFSYYCDRYGVNDPKTEQQGVLLSKLTAKAVEKVMFV